MREEDAFEREVAVGGHVSVQVFAIVVFGEASVSVFKLLYLSLALLGQAIIFVVVSVPFYKPDDHAAEVAFVSASDRILKL